VDDFLAISANVALGQVVAEDEDDVRRCRGA
jgi:hypothetical protein